MLRMKEIKESLGELENLFKTKQYYDYDGAEDYYKPIIVNGAFSNSYIQYESKGDNDKILTVDEYLDVIRFY